MSYFTTLVIAFIVILISMMLHELAHGFVAYKLGDDTAKTEGRLTLNPFKHLDPVLSIAMPLLLFFLADRFLAELSRYRLIHANLSTVFGGWRWWQLLGHLQILFWLS